MAEMTPTTHEPLFSAPTMPKNAPVSIIPSSAMFTTPLRSENMPPIAANVSGVAKRSIASRMPPVNTSSRFATLERVASSASAVPRTPAATAPQPIFRCPRETAQTPAKTARRPTRSDQTIERVVSGGNASQNATRPSTMPATPIVLGSASRIPPALGASAGTLIALASGESRPTG
jgi:hypothetical protein